MFLQAKVTWGALALLGSAGLAQAEVHAEAQHVAAEPSAAITYCFAVLLVAMILSLALEEKIHAKKSLIVALYAVVALIAGSAMAARA